MRSLRLAIPLLLALALLRAQSSSQRTAFRIKYVAEGAVYIDGGRAAGLAEHMTLTVESAGGEPVAELEVASVAESSAVCEIRRASAPLRVGETARLSVEDAQKAEILRAAGSKRYAQVITFTEGDPLDEDVRAKVPHPKLPEVNRIRGRIGFEHNGIFDRSGAGFNSSDVGLVFRSDMTRIGGTYWNLSGYTRLRRNSRSGGAREQTLNDLLNRTYHLTLYYNNPKSKWTAGLGRFYLPWAASLSTIDGGYVGRRAGRYATIGTFAGSTPDPTSWNYNPDRQMLGTFVNFEGGSFEEFKYTSTTGVAVSRSHWKPERQFVFFENSLYFKRYFSVYHNLEADKLRPAVSKERAAVTRSFLTLRIEPAPFVAFDLSHNYFRDLPTFDPRLIGTGLVDKLLFQGVSGGARIALPYRFSVYTNVGRSNRSGDEKRSLNQLYGVAVSDLLGTGVRADVRYTRFDSSFGRGAYKAISFSREVRELLRLEVQGGQQNFASTLTAQNRARYVNGNLDWFFTPHYFAGGGLTLYSGQAQNYVQTYFNVGHRF
jgi:hypothetical protein